MHPSPARRLPPSPRFLRLSRQGGVCLAMAAPAAWAGGLPEVFMSPLVTVGAGLATLGLLAGAGYILQLRQRLARLEARPAGGGAPAGLHDRQFRLAAAAGHGIEGLIGLDGRLIWANPAVERVTGHEAATLEAADFVELLVCERDRAFCRQRLRALVERGAPDDFELRIQHHGGGVRWMACHWQPVREEDGRLVGLRVAMEDIQARKEAEYAQLETVAALRRAQALSEHYLRRSNEERQRLSALLDVVKAGILFMDPDHRVVYCNRAFHEIWGVPVSKTLVGVRDVVLQRMVVDLLAEPDAFFRHLQDVVDSRRPSEAMEVRFKDGRILTSSSCLVPAPEGLRSIGRIWVFEDITAQREAAKQLQQMAERDPLTNLYNRRRFHEELVRMLADGQRRGEGVGLLAIDLDGFKPINDRFGHQAGDEVLVRLAAEVGAVVRRNEMFFRLGGDEFAILVPFATVLQLAELARRVAACIAGQRFAFGDGEVGVTASIGIAFSPQQGGDPETLVAAADRAMYVAKGLGGNSWAFAPAESAAGQLAADAPAG